MNQLRRHGLRRKNSAAGLSRWKDSSGIFGPEYVQMAIAHVYWQTDPEK